jgi:hypothetical protein
MSDPQKRRGGNPPDEFKFKKGRTGNPGGRPKGSKNIKTLVAQELEGPIYVQENGKRRRLKRGEALVKGIVNDAIGGKDRSRDVTLRYWDQIDRDRQAKQAETLREEDQAILDRYIEREIARRRRASGEGEQS